MSVEIVLDPDTGLPALPDDYFWRVTTTTLGLDVVELRKKTFWGMSRRIDHLGVQFYSISEDGTKTLAEPAIAIYNAAHKLAEEKLGSLKWMKYYGDYPPKNLKALYEKDNNS